MEETYRKEARQVNGRNTQDILKYSNIMSKILNGEDKEKLVWLIWMVWKMKCPCTPQSFSSWDGRIKSQQETDNMFLSRFH